MDIEEQDIYHGWHFLGRDRRLGYNDCRLVEKGEWMEMKPGPSSYSLGSNYKTLVKIDPQTDPALCRAGMHASSNIPDALQYALNGDILCQVEVAGDVMMDEKKFCGRYRRVVKWGCPDYGLEAFLKLVDRSASTYRFSDTDIMYIRRRGTWVQIVRRVLTMEKIRNSDLGKNLQKCIEGYLE